MKKLLANIWEYVFTDDVKGTGCCQKGCMLKIDTATPVESSMIFSDGRGNILLNQSAIQELKDFYIGLKMEDPSFYIIVHTEDSFEEHEKRMGFRE
jgi:hypothetical protein